MDRSTLSNQWFACRVTFIARYTEKSTKRARKKISLALRFLTIDIEMILDQKLKKSMELEQSALINHMFCFSSDIFFKIFQNTSNRSKKRNFLALKSQHHLIKKCFRKKNRKNPIELDLSTLSNQWFACRVTFIARHT